MKKMIFAVLAFTTVSFCGAWAQDEAKNKTNREEMFKNMVSKQADKLAEDMKLDDSKAADFKKTLRRVQKQGSGSEIFRQKGKKQCRQQRKRQA